MNLKLVSLPIFFLLFTIITLGLAIDSLRSCNSSSFYDYLSFTCRACPANTAPSTTGFCNCTLGTYKNPDRIGFLASNSCLTNSSLVAENQVYLTYNLDGTSFNSVVTCSSTAYPSGDRDQCKPCPRGSTYNSSTKSCYCSNFYFNGVCSNGTTSTLPVNSVFEQYAYKVASVGCSTDHSEQACQLLLNMCVSQQHASSGPFCQLLSNLTNNSAVPIPKEKITYNLDEIGIYISTTEYTNTDTLKNKLDFYLAVFNKYGSQVDFRMLTKELFLCDVSVGDSVKFQSFGSSKYVTCTLSISPTEPYFYDLYIKLPNGTYAEVPVLIKGSYYKRFTIQSDLLTRESMETPSTPDIKYPDVTLVLQYKPPLLTPYVTLSYTSDTSGSLQNVASPPSSSTSNILIPFIILNVLIFGWYVYKMHLYVTYNPQGQYETTYCFRVLWNAFWLAIRYWSVGLWIWLAGTSLYAFCFYKLQKTLFYYISDPSVNTNTLMDVEPFKTLFFITLVFSVLSCLELTWKITNAQFFLIDWQKPVLTQPKFQIGEEQQRIKASIWRKLFVVNQMYELAVKRVSSIEFTLLFVGLFLEGLKWSNLKYMVPNTDLTNPTKNYNDILSYFINTFLFFVIAAGQIFIKKLFRIQFPLPEEDFIDLCCLANVSVFIFDETLHGYYIHGMNPLGKAEGSLDFIESIFQKQSQSNSLSFQISYLDYGKTRGLIDTDPQEMQTFEIVIPKLLRYEFQEMYTEHLKTMITQNQMMYTIFNQPVPKLKLGDYDAIEANNKKMTQAFRLYLEEVRRNKSQVISRPWYSKFFECPPSEIFYQKLPVFFKDPDCSFTNVFLIGNEWHWLLLEINLFNFWFLLLKSTYNAIFLTFIFARLFMRLLQEFKTKRNLAMHTLVDDKFFW